MVKLYPHVIIATVLAAICATTCSCSDSKDSPEAPAVTVAVNPSTFEISSEAQTLTLDVKADADWSITSDSEWASVRPGGGMAGQSTAVKVTVKANTDMVPRKASLTVKAGKTRETVTITQNPTHTVTLSSTRATMGAQSSSTEIEVTSNTDWTAEADASWLSLTPASGKSGTTKMTVKAAANDSGSDRTANVTVKYAGGEQTLEVRQLSDAVTTPEGYTLVWSDEFNEGTMPNTSRWYYETGAGGWGNNEIQDYVAGEVGGQTLAKIENGILNIICAKINGKIYSIRMNTRDSWTYGYFEARLKLPKGKGTWPAFWMMPKNFTSWPADGEIDIMEEVGYHPNYVSSSVHCTSYNHSIGTQKTREILVPTAQEDFHVYALEWTADYIRTYVDGEILFTFANDGKGDKNTWPFNAPFYIKLNLAWGGDWGGQQGVDESCLPADYQVDYVRVFQKN